MGEHDTKVGGPLRGNSRLHWQGGMAFAPRKARRLWLAGTQTEVAVGKEMPVPEHQMWILGMKEQKGGEGSRKADHDNLWGRRI